MCIRDRLGSPSGELERLLGTYSKIGGARAAGAHISWAENRSQSFLAFVRAIERLCAR